MLPELSESEVGPLVAGDWLTMVNPFMSDLSSSSSLWWQEVLRVSGDCYRQWLEAEPMERLRLDPSSPEAFRRAPWLRVEQRGQVALLRALPESLKTELVAQREVDCVHIVYKILRVYQPGGLGERTALLKQLVDQKVPQSMTEWMMSLRNWRRWLVRIAELRIQPPDPVLLLATLDKYSGVLAKNSPQVSFRLQIARAALRVDIAPTPAAVQQFAEALQAEGEAVYHGGATLPLKENMKLKAVDAKDGKVKSPEKEMKPVMDKPKEKLEGVGAPMSGGKGKGKQSTACRYFLSEQGCKKGKACGFSHEWGEEGKMGRCWNCGSTQHMKPDCPVKEQQNPRVRKEMKPEAEVPGTEKSGGERGAGGSTTSPGSAMASTGLGKEDSSGELMMEAVKLLRLLKPSAKAVKVSSLKEAGGGRALLDGGATHILRPAFTEQEYDEALPIKVELAAGETVLRQDPATGTLLTNFETQVIIPLGKVVRMGYKVTWENDMFEMCDGSGSKVEVELQSGCPTVAMETAWQLIDGLEKEETEAERRCRALRVGDPGDLDPRVWRWLNDLREMWPEVPDDLLVRVIPTGNWDGSSLPWNRRQRKRFRTCDSVIVHLFSGPDQSWWKRQLETKSRAVLCVDKEANLYQDLLRDEVTSYLAEVCEQGNVDSLIGGPPCRTVSKLRFRSPALRSREGPQRFALDDLTVAQKELAWGDAVLWMRQLWLYTLAQGSRQKKVSFLKEHPRDPQEYKDTQDGIDYPSFFAWPEWEAFKKKYALEEIRMDMGACGHSRRKPSTNLRPLKLLEGRCGSGKQVTEDYETLGLDGRMKASRSWAAWPVDFKLEVVKWSWNIRLFHGCRRRSGGGIVPWITCRSAGNALSVNEGREEPGHSGEFRARTLIPCPWIFVAHFVRGEIWMSRKVDTLWWVSSRFRCIGRARRWLAWHREWTRC